MIIRLYSVNYGYYVDSLHNNEGRLFHTLTHKVTISCDNHMRSCELVLEYAHKVEQQMRIESSKALVSPLAIVILLMPTIAG